MKNYNKRWNKKFNGEIDLLKRLGVFFVWSFHHVNDHESVWREIQRDRSDNRD